MTEKIEKKMNIYEKLNAARLRFINSGAKKSGYNSFAKYHYFELSDILPVVNKAAADLGFCCIVRFRQEEATLDFVSAEPPHDRITFSSPLASIDLKNNHEIQNLGALQTYIRRYLYLAAFEVVEGDAIDATATPPTTEQAAKPTAPQPAKGAQSPTLVEDDIFKTPEAKEMRRILHESSYPNGELIFSADDKKYWKQELKAKGGCAALAALKGYLVARLDAQKAGVI